MTWIVWRQQRPMFITLAAGLVVAVAAVLLLRAGMVADLNARNLVDCVGKGMTACMGQNSAEFQATWFDRMHVAHGLVIAAPALMGVFVGAPLFAREYEQGTHALAFTQSISRTRWMATKFVVAAVPALAAVVVFQLAVRGWVAAAGRLGPLATGPFYFSTFDAQSVSPIAYTLFAYTLGMFAGALFKRTLVAMSLTLALFVAVRTAVGGLREFMITPTRLVWDDPTIAHTLEPRPLITDQGYLDASGAPVADAASRMNCGSKDGEPIRDTLTCYRENGIAKAYADVVPVDQATTLHLLEASVFAGLAVLFVLGSVWAVRRQV